MSLANIIIYGKSREEIVYNFFQSMILGRKAVRKPMPRCLILRVLRYLLTVDRVIRQKKRRSFMLGGRFHRAEGRTDILYRDYTENKTAYLVLVHSSPRSMRNKAEV